MNKEAIHAQIQNVIAASLTEEQKRRFMLAYMQVTSVGVPYAVRPVGYYDDWEKILEELKSQSDRAAAIVGVALRDAKLERTFAL